MEEVMKRIFRKILLITALLVAVGMMLGASNAAEAKTKSLKTKTIAAGSSVNLRVKGKATWAISNAAVARMTVLSQNKAKVTGLTQGTTRITAKVGGTKYKATIRVKGSTKSQSSNNNGNSNNSNSNNNSNSGNTAQTEAAKPAISNVVQSLSSAPVSGTIDSIYYLSTGAQVIGHFDEGFSNMIVAQTNAYRSSNGVTTLGADSVLTEAAKTRAAEAAVVFSHTRPNGLSYYTVGGTVDNNYQDSPVFGENLAYGYNNANETMAAWIASTQGHRENLVRNTFTKIGVAVLWVKQSDGSYMAYIAQEFG